MSIFNEEGRYREGMNRQHDSSQVSETEKRASRYQSHAHNYNRWERLRDQQQSRDYWVRMYGYEAELLSRGGVSWLGGW